MLYSFLCATLWASSGIFIKFIDGLSVPGIIWGRFLIALFFGLIFTQRSAVSRLFAFRQHSWNEHALALMMTAYYVLATYSVTYIPVAMSALLIALTPLFTFLFRFFLKGEFNRNELLGFFIAFLGLMLYFYGKDYAAEGYSLNSILLGATLSIGAAILRAAFSYIIWDTIGKGRNVDATFINNHTLLLGVILLSPGVFLSNYSLGSYHFTVSDFSFLLGLGVIATFIPNALNTLSSIKLNPTTHNIIGMSTPISASFMSWMFLGEAQNMISLVAMIITVFGIFISMKFK